MKKSDSASQQIGTYNVVIRRLTTKEQPSHQDYLEAFGELPDIILKAHGVLATDLHEGDFGIMLDSHRDTFKAIKPWLVHFEQHSGNFKTPDPPELRKSWKFDFKPHAESNWLYLDLCQAILERDRFGWQDFINSPVAATELWFSCQYERLEASLCKTGVLDRAERRGKQAVCDANVRQIYTDFETLYQRRFADPSEFDPTQIQTWDSTQEAIRIHAEYIAQEDKKFAYQIYKPYVDAQKRTMTKIRNNRNIQEISLNADGSLSVGGKGKRGKGKKKTKSKKGFS